MAQVIDRSELCQAMIEGVERVVFPANANLLLNDGSLAGEQVTELEAIARNCGRLVHLR